ncbi:unnamed protein product [Thlaspi arvense]|uniref:Uncharacterized protein n=1 Tax=Thlaspi arvense TaxID=13288 RepID=A0AAU9SCS7_THLAR|nr:unnamed protein product [Thlaspi arvense]
MASLRRAVRGDFEILISRSLCSRTVKNRELLRMLQWMGGSRRKVAASHTSVKKRQKQYFEQRRQQQHQLSVGPESCTNDRNNSNQHLREHQSLDILNFLNLSTTATPECKPSCPEDGMEDLDSDFYSIKDNIAGVGKVSKLMICESGPVLVILHVNFDASLSYRTSFSVPDNQKNELKKADTTADLMDGTERKLSVFDLVGDDHTTTNLEECSPSEAHMAFSVEGLGKINTETPVNSPQPSDRNFAYRCSSPWKDAGQPDTSNVRQRLNEFEKEVDTLIESSNMFQDDSPYRSPVGIHGNDGGRKQKLRTFSDHLHKPYVNDSRSYFCDVSDFNKSRVFDENEWNAKPTFLDDREGSFHWKDQQPCQENVNLNFMNYGNDYTDSRSSEEHHGTNKRDYLETTWRSNIEDSPVRRPLRLERTIDHPTIAKAAYFKSPDNFDFDNVFDQPVWSSIVPEEDKDSHSLRSEESCSSSAVWANETPIPQFKTKKKQRKREINSFGKDKNYLKNNLFQESWEDWDVDDQHLNTKVGSGKQVRLSKPGNLKSTSQRESSFRGGGGLDAPYNWFAEGFTAAGISSDITTERDKPYPILNPEVGRSHWRQSRAPDFPKFSVGGTGEDDDEHDYVNCSSANHKSKLAGDICSFESDTLSENDNEQSKEVNRPKSQGDETSSSVAKSLSDENEYVRRNPKKEVMEARQQGNRETGEKTSRDSFQQLIMLERRTLQLVCLNKTLLLGTLKT